MDLRLRYWADPFQVRRPSQWSIPALLNETPSLLLTRIRPSIWVRVPVPTIYSDPDVATDPRHGAPLERLDHDPGLNEEL